MCSDAVRVLNCSSNQFSILNGFCYKVVVCSCHFILTYVYGLVLSFWKVNLSYLLLNTGKNILTKWSLLDIND